MPRQPPPQLLLQHSPHNPQPKPPRLSRLHSLPHSPLLIPLP